MEVCSNLWWLIFPGKKILNALENLYGDEFPFTEGDSMDVRQAVVLARLTMGRNNSWMVLNLGSRSSGGRFICGQ
jgi:hypothetical protein